MELRSSFDEVSEIGRRATILVLYRPELISKVPPNSRTLLFHPSDFYSRHASPGHSIQLRSPYGDRLELGVSIRKRPISRQFHPNRPFSKSKETLRNPIFANPNSPSNSF